MQDDCITVALGLPELRVLAQHEEGHQITVEVMYRARSVRCPGCAQETVRVHSVQRQYGSRTQVRVTTEKRIDTRRGGFDLW